MINNDIIQERIIVLDADIIKVRQKLAELEQQKLESVALMNALTGARQQCDNFLIFSPPPSSSTLLSPIIL